VIVLFLLLGNARGAIIVALTIPFSLLFASICLKLQGTLLAVPALDPRYGNPADRVDALARLPERGRRRNLSAVTKNAQSAWGRQAQSAFRHSRRVSAET